MSMYSENGNPPPKKGWNIAHIRNHQLFNQGDDVRFSGRETCQVKTDVFPQKSQLVKLRPLKSVILFGQSYDTPALHSGDSWMYPDPKVGPLMEYPYRIALCVVGIYGL